MRKAGWKRRASALVALFMALIPYFVFAGTCMAQTKPGEKTTWQDDWLNQGKSNQGPGMSSDSSNPAYNTSPDKPYEHLPRDLSPGTKQQTTLAQQAAEQKLDSMVAWDLTKPMGFGNDVYQGLHQWYSDDLFDNLFSGIGQLFGKWAYEFITGWMCDAVRFLTAALATFVLNPNIANNATQPGNDDISKAVHQFSDVMMSIAIDLMLILFVLAIWRYWSIANWTAQVNPLAPVMRMIATGAILLAWPTLYSFITQLCNELIKAIWFNTADSMADFDQAITTIIKAGLVDSAAGLIMALAPVMGTMGTASGLAGKWMGLVGGSVAFAAELIFGILTAIIIAQLLALLVLKAVQTAILIAQYMLAPIFIVTLALPDIASYCVKFMHTFVIVNLWTFAWLALFRLFVIVINSSNSPWGKILLVVGILQLMVQAPLFLTTGMVDPKSFFLDGKDIIDKARGMPGALAGGVKTWWANQQGAVAPAPQGNQVVGTATAAGLSYAGFNNTNASVSTGTGTPATASAASPNLTVGGQQNQQNPNAQQNAQQNALNQNTQGQNLQNQQGQQQGQGQTQATAGFNGTLNPTQTQAQTGTTTPTGAPVVAAGGMPPTKQAFNAGQVFTPQMQQKADVAGFVDKIKDGDIQIVTSTNGMGGANLDFKNRMTEVLVPEGASAVETGRHIAVAAGANMMLASPIGRTMAEKMSHSLGYDGPQDGDIAIAAKEGKAYPQSRIAELRKMQGMQRAAYEESQAHFNGKQGHTGFMQQKWGQWTEERQAELDSIMTDPDRVDSPWAASYGTVSDNLGALAIRPTVANRAAAANPWIMSMNKGQQAKAIRSVSAYVQQLPDLAGLVGPEKDAAMGRLAQGLSAGEVEIITETFINSNGAELPVLNEHYNAGVQTLKQQNLVRRDSSAHRLISQFSGGSRQQAKISASVTLVESALKAGVNESQLLRSEWTEVGKHMDHFVDGGQIEYIPDLAVSAKILGAGNTTVFAAETVHAMRHQQWDVHRIRPEELRAAQNVLSRRDIPTQAAVRQELAQQRGANPPRRNP